ncbi:MAG TPA: sugar phosphate isomerase/epimerase [Bryobacteraceae bacterium]|nr:sugar phosphate isomerase/epimerase [Bryobacteraceae bacterium]
MSAANSPGIRLGFDTYSIRDFRWKDIQLLDYAASLKLDTVQLSGLHDYESLDPAHLTKVKDHAEKVGISIDAGIGCICPLSTGWNPNQGTPADYLRKGLRVAKAVGAQSMRCYMGGLGDRPNLERCMEATINALRSVRTEALDLGVKIGVENHSGDMQAREVKMLIEAAGKDFVGSCLDTGNPMWVVENPLVSLEVLGPYVVTTHVRDSAVFEHPRGAAAQWVALGDGSVDFKTFVAKFQKICPRAAMQLEIITGRPPAVLPYLDPDFWKHLRNTPASEFARFIALARSGHPYIGPMVIGGPGKQPPVIEEALKEQERTDLERSFEYAKKVLGVGIKWKS